MNSKATDRELLELIAAQVGSLTTQVGSLTTQVGSLTTQAGSLTTQVGSLTNDMVEVKNRLNKIEGTVTHIENDHGQKLSALFDGYKLHSEQLDRIESKVSTHDELILKKIK